MSDDEKQILLVDDHPDTLELAASLIESFGHGVVCAQNGSEALETLRLHPGIRLLLTDIMMPGMSGWDLAQEARQMRPELKIIYTSDFAQMPPAGIETPDKDKMMPKPWRFHALQQKILEALG